MSRTNGIRWIGFLRVFVGLAGLAWRRTHRTLPPSPLFEVIVNAIGIDDLFDLLFSLRNSY